MWRIPADLEFIAERVAVAENRVSKLRNRVERLTAEGSDATQARELLEVARSLLGQLYAQQSQLRRSAWTFSR